MKKILLVLLFLPLLFSSCLNDSQKNTSQDSITDAVFSFNVTSKNSELTTKSGRDVSIDEMETINVQSGDKIFFKTFHFTLDNKVDGALNFYINNGTLMCNTPTELSIMSMPPKGDGLNTLTAGDNFVISGTTLIKVNSINFVISDFKTIE